MKYRVINSDLWLQCGKDFDTFTEAVQYRFRLLRQFPDMRLIIKDVRS